MVPAMNASHVCTGTTKLPPPIIAARCSALRWNSTPARRGAEGGQEGVRRGSGGGQEGVRRGFIGQNMRGTNAQSAGVTNVVNTQDSQEQALCAMYWVRRGSGGGQAQV
eukprot:1181244-Prorocentrum_minimum.AAC.1